MGGYPFRTSIFETESSFHPPSAHSFKCSNERLLEEREKKSERERETERKRKRSGEESVGFRVKKEREWEKW